MTIGLDLHLSTVGKIIWGYSNHAPRYHVTESCDPSRSFFGTQPRRSFDYRGQKCQVYERTNHSNGRFLPRPRVLPRVQPRCPCNGSRFDEDRFDRHNDALLGIESRSTSHDSPRFWWSCPIRSNKLHRGPHARRGVRGGLRAFASSISSILLSRKMKYHRNAKFFQCPPAVKIYIMGGWHT